ncbi:MAG TPA: hypothetical protein VGL99_23100 [Chloroflexota bacterium]
MRHTLVAALTVALMALAPIANAQGDAVIVNRQPISTGQVQALEWYYGTTISPGSYWYDAVSGLWGNDGGPWTGQIEPGLILGGPLRSDASNGHTGVYFNGRQLHSTEVDYLKRLFGTVPQGRYWLEADGTGGPEGGDASFSLTARASNNGNGYSAPSYAGNTSRGAFGTYGSDGNCFYIAVDGGDVLGPGC